MKKRWHSVLTIGLCIFAGSVQGQSANEIQVDKDGYVKSIPPYLIKTSYFPADAGDVTQLDIKRMQAYTVAYQAFQKTPDISIQRKQLSNYFAIYVSEDAKNYYVLFLSKEKIRHVPPSYTLMDGETYFGQTTRYTIRKTDSKIIERQFYLM